MRSLNIAGHCWVKNICLPGLRTESTAEGSLGEFVTMRSTCTSQVLQKDSWPAECLQQPTRVMTGIEAPVGDAVLKILFSP